MHLSAADPVTMARVARATAGACNRQVHMRDAVFSRMAESEVHQSTGQCKVKDLAALLVVQRNNLRNRPYMEFTWFSASIGPENLDATFTAWWFGTCFIFPYIGKDHPNWRTHIFSEG